MISRELGVKLLSLSRLAENPKKARLMLNSVLDTGQAAEHFARMVSMQGGPSDLLEQPESYLPAAPVVRALTAPRSGCIEYMDTRAIGLCIVGLGGGRRRARDKIDHRVGLSQFCLVGQPVCSGDPLVIIHAADETSWQAAAGELQDAIAIGRFKDSLPAVYEQFP